MIPWTTKKLKLGKRNGCVWFRSGTMDNLHAGKELQTQTNDNKYTIPISQAHTDMHTFWLITIAIFSHRFHNGSTPTPFCICICTRKELTPCRDCDIFELSTGNCVRSDVSSGIPGETDQRSRKCVRRWRRCGACTGSGASTENNNENQRDYCVNMSSRHGTVP